MTSRSSPCRVSLSSKGRLLQHRQRGADRAHKWGIGYRGSQYGRPNCGAARTLYRLNIRRPIVSAQFGRPFAHQATRQDATRRQRSWQRCPKHVQNSKQSRLREADETVQQHADHFWRTVRAVPGIGLDRCGHANQEKYYSLLERTTSPICITRARAKKALVEVSYFRKESAKSWPTHEWLTAGDESCHACPYR